MLSYNIEENLGSFGQEGKLELLASGKFYSFQKRQGRELFFKWMSDHQLRIMPYEFGRRRTTWHLFHSCCSIQKHLQWARKQNGIRSMTELKCGGHWGNPWQIELDMTKSHCCVRAWTQIQTNRCADSFFVHISPDEKARVYCPFCCCFHAFLHICTPSSVGVMGKMSGMKALPEGWSDRADTLARLHVQTAVGMYDTSVTSIHFCSVDALWCNLCHLS